MDIKNTGSSFKVIYPPIGQKDLVDKTAKFVALNGEEFEYKIIQKEGSNAKFNFLKPDNPYHGYYKMSTLHFLKLIAEDKPLKEPEAPTPKTVLRNRLLQQKKKKKKVRMQRNIPTSDPLPIDYNLEIPSKITPLELDIIKLTAMFIAKNGLDFLGVIAGRESRNRRFDFLKIGHKHFNFYSKLVDVYKMVLKPNQTTIEKVKFFSALENKVKILDIIYSKKEWVDFLSQKKKKEEEEKKMKEEQEEMIDWNDFVIVETIDFDDGDLLVTEIRKINDDELDDDEMDIDDGMEIEQTPAPIILQKKVEEIVEYGDKKVVDNYVRKKRVLPTKKEQNFVRDPITGVLINKDKTEKHMKIQLIDPIFKENKKREMQKFLSTNVADDKEVAEHLKELSQRRTDIFGKEETEIGRKVQEEEDDENDKKKYIWDGRQKTIPLIPPPPKNPNKESRKRKLPPPPSHLNYNTNISLEVYEQIQMKAQAAAQAATTHKVSTPNVPVPTSYNFYQNNFLQQPTKKKRSGLQSSDEWEKKVSGKVNVNVQIPKVNRENWKLEGQMEIIEIDITSKVYLILKELENRLGIPTSKQRLRSHGIGFIKPSKKLSFYNFSENQKCELVLKKK